MINPENKPLHSQSGQLGFVGSFGWIAIEKIMRIVAGFVIGAMVARYLGPEHYGRLQVALAYAAIFSTLGNLGLDTILHRIFATASAQQEKKVFAIAFWFRLFGGLLGGCAVVLIGIFQHETELRSLLLIIAFTTIQPAGAVVELWMQATGRNALSCVIQITVLALTIIIRFLGIWFHCSVYYFGAVCLFEAFFSFCLFAMTGRNRGLMAGLNRIAWRDAKYIMAECLPMLAAAIAASVYQKLDMLYVERSCSAFDLGQYSVAVRLCEAMYFMPVVLATAVAPRLARARLTNNEVFASMYRDYLALSVGCGMILSCSVMILSPYIIGGLFGHRYDNAIPILCVRVWVVFFLFCEVARSMYLIQIGRSACALSGHLAGVAVALTLPFGLVPLVGLRGAALAAIASMAMAGWLSCWFNRDSKEIGRQICYFILRPDLWVGSIKRMVGDRRIYNEE